MQPSSTILCLLTLKAHSSVYVVPDDMNPKRTDA